MKTTLSVLVLLAVLDVLPLRANSQSRQDTTEILLIGSSYFNYNNLAGLIEGLTNTTNHEIHIEMHGQNGLYLADHAVNPATEAKINERNWDFVILQGVGVLVAYPEHFTDHPVYPALVKLRDKIYANCETTRMFFCLPWAFEDGMTWYENWTDTYEDMQIHIYNNTLQYSEEIGFEIAPVGWSWYGVLDDLNYPLHYLHMSDWNHPSLKGSYLMACTIYSSMFQESTVGNTYLGGVPEEEAIYFQTVASDTVLNNLQLWNINPITTIEKHPVINQFHLKQNFPNPFSSSTTISYSLSNILPVSLSVFDASGNKIKQLLDKEQRPGEHEVIFDATGFTGGIYFYQIMVGNYSETKSMIKDFQK